MADIFTIAAPATPFALNRSMIGIFNSTGSGKVVKVYRIVALNNQTVAVTGISALLEIQRISTGSGGIALLPVKHDSFQAALPGQIVCATNMSYTNNARLGRRFWSSDEPSQYGIATTDEWQTIPRLSMLWESSYKDTNVQPIVLRQGYGISVNNTSNTIVGVADFFIEFTVENA